MFGKLDSVNEAYSAAHSGGLGFACVKQWGAEEDAALRSAISASLEKIAGLVERAEQEDQAHGAGAGDWLDVGAEIYWLDNRIIEGVREKYRAHAPAQEWECEAKEAIANANSLLDGIKEVLDAKKAAQVKRHSDEWELKKIESAKKVKAQINAAQAAKAEKDAAFAAAPKVRRFASKIFRIGPRVVCEEKIGTHTHQWVLAEPRERNSAVSDVGNIRLFELRPGDKRPTVVGDSIDAQIFQQKNNKK